VPSHLKGQHKQEGKDGGRDNRAASKTHPMKCEQVPNRLIRCVHSGQVKPDCKGSSVANLSNSENRCTSYLWPPTGRWYQLPDRLPPDGL